MIGLFTLFSLAFHLQWQAPLDILHLTLVLVLMLLTLIGGRITPAFTRNWLNRQSPTPERLPAAFGPLDAAAAVMTAISGLVWVFWPQSMVAAVLLALGGWGCSWYGYCAGVAGRTRSEPLLWVLHLGYGWIGIGQLLLAGGSAGFWLSSAGLHALTIGAMGGMIMAVCVACCTGAYRPRARVNADTDPGVFQPAPGGAHADCCRALASRDATVDYVVSVAVATGLCAVQLALSADSAGVIGQLQ